MKVLLLSHSSGPESLGGAELALLQLIDSWKAATPGVDFFVVSRNPPGLLQGELDRRTVGHESVDFGSWVCPPRSAAAVDVALNLRMESWAVQRLTAVIDEFVPDLVVTNTIVSPWAAIAARLGGVPHAWLVHEYGDLDHGLEFQQGRESTFRDIDLLSDLVVANSVAVRDHIAPWITPEKLIVAYPMMNLDRVRELAARPHEVPGPRPGVGLEGAVCAVMVGRISPSKGQWRLVAAVAQLRDEGIDVVATIVGSASADDARALESVIDSLGVSDRVHMVGETENPFNIAAEAHVAVMASDCEAFGRVTVEYMTLGLPVIASRTGANIELVIEGLSGWLFDPDDPTDLARALREASQDRAELETRGLAAARDVEQRIAVAYPLIALIARLEQIAAAGPTPMRMLPTVVRQWFNLPRTIETYLQGMDRVRIAARASMEWRVGRAVTLPLRVVLRALRLR
jgi:glycosyltransferase involved in cell wall biosynthesis